MTTQTIANNTVINSQETKEAICNAILMGQVFHDAIRSLPTEIQFDMHKQVLDFQRKLVPLLPTQTQQWVMKELQKEKLKILPVALKHHIKAGEGPHELIYTETNNLLDYLSYNKKRAKKLSVDKYAGIFQYIRRELEADITNGTPGIDVLEGSIVFKLVNPTPGKRQEE
jgi:hypothetical protein